MDHLIQSMLEGKMPGFPNLFIPAVDVREIVAAAESMVKKGRPADY